MKVHFFLCRHKPFHTFSTVDQKPTILWTHVVPTSVAKSYMEETKAPPCVELKIESVCVCAVHFDRHRLTSKNHRYYTIRPNDVKKQKEKL